MVLGIDRLPLGDIPVPLHIHIVSHTPGRLRFRVGREQRQPEVMAEIASVLQSFSGEIEHVRTRTASGSVTVYYAAEESASFNNTMASLQELGMVVVDVPEGLSSASIQVSRVLSQANQWLEFTTEGAIDLRFLMPLVFAVLALRQAIAQSSGLNTAPWYVLAWYAFDSFYKLNYERPAPPPTPDTKS